MSTLCGTILFAIKQIKSVSNWEAEQVCLLMKQDCFQMDCQVDCTAVVIH